MVPHRVISPVFAVILLSCPLALGGCAESSVKASAPQEQPRAAVGVTPLTEQLLTRTVRVPGVLHARSELDLSFKVPGVIKRVAVEEGARVRRGQLLAVIDPTELAAGSAQADVALAKAERDVLRTRSLHESGGVPRNSLDDAETALAIAREGAVTAGFNLRHSELRAPDDGIIDRRMLEVGEVVQATRPVMHFRASGPAEVHVALVDREALAVTPGDPAKVSLDARPGDALRARVTRVASSATAGTGTFEVELALDDPRAATLPSGLTAKVSFSRSEPALSVPLTALVDGDGQEAALFVVEQGRAQRRKVRVAFLEGERAALQEGPPAGALVVSAGASELRDGASVRVVGEE